jgi:hypothetical protein
MTEKTAGAAGFVRTFDGTGWKPAEGETGVPQFRSVERARAGIGSMDRRPERRLGGIPRWNLREDPRVPVPSDGMTPALISMVQER